MRRMPLAIALLAALVPGRLRLGRVARHDVRRVHCAEGAGDDLVLEPLHRTRARRAEQGVRGLSQAVPVDHGEEHGEHESDEADGRDPWWQRTGCSGPVRDRHPGAFCASGAWIDLSSRIKSDRVNLNLFPKTIRDYTAYGDQRCALPLLADAYGFYYNKALFAKRGTQVGAQVTRATRSTRRS